MTDTLSIRAALSADMQEIEQTLLLGFATDPLFRFLWPKASSYLSIAEGFTMTGRASVHGGHAKIAGDFSGVCLWLPPGVKADEDAFAAFFDGTSLTPTQINDITENHEALARCKPIEPFWYLSLLAIDPACQNLGIGSALMKHTLRELDEINALTYLVSSNPRNLSFYRSHGFKQVTTIKTGCMPEMFPMLRQPKNG
ncbi:Uncharacterised protein [BD1-7 clade bacterium]|uniref:N-acetyltransferase domain-containing protein n=1 Tax=BD1-7 clade bacterium TaxID=2029982 RepID=A0A5S9MRH6_9GAMM|nr:Uncharacterised protein [BD1-7 clade bacterium]